MTNDQLQELAPHMIVGLSGPRLSDDEKALLASLRFSGVILFERNVRDARQLMELAREIRNVFRQSHGYVPLIAADHEGGLISVLGRAIGVPPTQMAAARTGDAHLCERLFTENARRLRACGVNMLLGPVADINSEHRNPVIGTRSFGEDAEAVSSFVSAAVSAARAGGVLTCIKHFPGHGASSVDSHLALPVLSATLDQLRKKDMLPFASGLKAGAESVMVGHIAAQGRSLPASLDTEIIDGLLRKELGFEGVVMTDALEMEGVRAAEPRAAGVAGGILARRDLWQSCGRALGAGNDILLFSKPVAEVVSELRALEGSGAGAVLLDGLSPDLLRASKVRIERLLEIASRKDREFELPSDPGVYGEIAERSIGVKEKAEVLPLRGSEGGLRAIFYVEKGEFARFPLQSFVMRVLQGSKPFGEGAGDAATGVRFGRHVLFPYDSLPNGATGIEALASYAGEPDAHFDCIFLMNRRPLSQEAITEMCSGARAVVVAGWPYAVDFIARGPHVLITYGIYDAAADAVRSRLMA